jgi:arylsulfatase A-like enzyme
MGNRLQAHPEKIAKYQARLGLDKPAEKAVYAAMIEHLDDCVGRIVRKLDELQLAEKTLIVFTSDNGGYGEKTNNAPLRDAKSSGYEGGLRVPTIIRMPGRIGRETKSSIPVITADIFPTVMAAAGARPQKTEALDGINLLPLITEGQTPDRTALFWHYPHFSARAFSAVRAGRWKLIEFFEASGLRHELYDLVDDLGEQRDLAREQPERVRELKAQLDNWRTSVGARVPTRLPAP